jgi:hypothetical protein
MLRIAVVVFVLLLALIHALERRRRFGRFSPEYIKHVVAKSPRWKLARWLCMNPLLGRDCVLPVLRAHHCHHLHYRNLGHELPIRDIVPLHRITHDVVHVAGRIFGRRAINGLLRFCYCFWLACEFLLIFGLFALVRIRFLNAGLG